MTPLRCHLADSLSDVLCYSGVFEDNTFMYMIEPLELIHDEVGLGHQFSFFWCLAFPSGEGEIHQRVLLHAVLFQT